MSDKELCQNCEKNESDGYHQCPFQVEIHDDESYTCNCCEDCTHECAMDV